MRLIVTLLAAATLGTQLIVSAQCSCGSAERSWSPFHRLLTSPLPSEHDIRPRASTTCSCSCSQRRLPPRLHSPPPPAAPEPHGVTTLSGVVLDSPVFQQVGPATIIETPPPLFTFSPDQQDSSSHIMSIPRRQDSFDSFENCGNTFTTSSDDVPTITYSTAPNAKPSVVFSSNGDSPFNTYSPNNPQLPPCQQAPSNSNFPSAPHSSPAPSPQPMYFPQPTPLMASCPATLFYPAAPMTYSQPSLVYPAVPSFPMTPAAPPSSQRVDSGFCSSAGYSNSANNPAYFTTPPQVTVPNFSQSFPSRGSSTIPNNPPTKTYSTSPPQVCNSPQTNAQPLSTESFQNAPSNTLSFSDSGSSEPGTQMSDMNPHTTTNDSPLSYTLLPSGTNNNLADINSDCSVPSPPFLV